MDDLISRAAAIDAFSNNGSFFVYGADVCKAIVSRIKQLPAAQPTLYGYNIEHLKLIATVLQEEDLPPERVSEALTDTGRIVAIVMNEFEKELRKAVEQCTT